jgi:hypothetical protein
VEDRAYFDFTLMLHRIQAEIFCYALRQIQCINPSKLDLPDAEDQDIIKDEIIILKQQKAIETGISEQKLRLVHVYKQDENKVIKQTIIRMVS